MNGVPTQDYPAVGVLLQVDNSGTLSEDCTATLIGCDTVLTAAHCICGEENPAAQCITLNLPDTKRTQLLFALQNAGPFALKSIAIDPEYDFNAGKGDVAVLKLSTPVTGIPPAHINTEGEVPTGTAATIVGFGETGLDLNDTGLKRSGTITTAPCIDPTDGTLRAGLVCWKFESPIGLPGQNSTTCFGDSGGPLFADLGSGLKVAGVTSGAVPATCAPGAATFDADVYSYRAWIEQQAGADLNSSRCGSIAQLGEDGAASIPFSGYVSGVAEDTYFVEVQPNTVEVRFALNGEDRTQGRPLDLANQFDLRVNYGAPSTSSDYLCLDNTPDPYGFCGFTNPAPGTWYIAIPATGFGAYQLTVTTFEPPAPSTTTTPSATPTPHPATATRTESPTLAAR